MLDRSSRPKSYFGLTADDKDLTMFTITNLSLKLETDDNLVYMALKLKRKVKGRKRAKNDVFFIK